MTDYLSPEVAEDPTEFSDGLKSECDCFLRESSMQQFLCMEPCDQADYVSSILFTAQKVNQICDGDCEARKYGSELYRMATEDLLPRLTPSSQESIRDMF